MPDDGYEKLDELISIEQFHFEWSRSSTILETELYREVGIAALKCN